MQETEYLEQLQKIPKNKLDQHKERAYNGGAKREYLLHNAEKKSKKKLEGN